MIGEILRSAVGVFFAMGMTVMVIFMIMAVLSSTSLSDRESGALTVGFVFGSVIFGGDNLVPPELQQHRGAAVIGAFAGILWMGSMIFKRSKADG